MTKKDFIAIAAILKGHGAPEEMVEAFCQFFHADNPRFKPSVFRKACGLEARND